MTRLQPVDKAAAAAAVTGSAASSSAALTSKAAKKGPAAFGIAPLLQSLTPLLSSPLSFLSPSPTLTASLLAHAKLCYDRSYTVSSSSALLPPSAVLSSLPSLLVDGFTVEQVWEQLQLLHRPLLQRLRKETRKMEQAAASSGTQEEKETAQDDEQVEHEDDEEDAADEDDGDEELDGDDAEMEARLDAMEAKEQPDDGDGDEQAEDEEDEEEVERHGQAEAELSDGVDDRDGQPRPSRPSKKRARSSASAAPPAAAPREVSADAFFSLEQMERFADHFERIDNDPEAAARRREKMRADRLRRKRAARQAGAEDGEEEEEEDEDADDAADEYGGDVDLDVDVGEVDMAHGEKYGDFFDPPTAEELRGQSITEMEEGGEADDGEAGEDGEEAEDGEEDGTAPSPEDEFGGYFARLAAQQRKLSARPPAAAAAASAAESAAALSSYGRQQAALQPTLASLEHQLVNPKPWYHRGEVSAMQRPADSLLQEELQVDWAGKEREVITAEVNEQIEDVIRRRVSEAQYDDVVRKEKQRTQRTVRDDAELSSERSSKGLAQLYEEEYLERKKREDAEAAGGAAPKTSSKAAQQRDAQVAEIRSLLSSLLSSLASLSNYSVAAPVSSEEVRIVRGQDEQQLLMREEVGIDFESGEGGARGSSRKEVGGSKTQGEMVGEGEREQQERKRRRRRMKAAGRKRKREEEQQDKQRTSEAKPNRLGGRALLTAKEVQEAKSARNVKAGVVSPAAATARYGKSSSFFRELQANVQAAEQDARRERAGKA